LERFEYKFPGYNIYGVMPPGQYLKPMVMLLTGEAEMNISSCSDGAEDSEELLHFRGEKERFISSLSNSHYDPSNLCSMSNFPFRAVELSPMLFDIELAELYQGSENLIAAGVLPILVSFLNGARTTV